jgi:anti-sigma regulatory factor (Ser/Thr protein kinase)
VTEQEHAAPPRTAPQSASPLPSLPPPGDDAISHTYRTDLSKVRALVLQQARAAGLAEGRATDLVLAVSEVAANTLRHTQSAGTLTIWRQPGELVCEIQDEGMITDPLAGQRRPGLVHQVCDVVELRSDDTGTTIRMHMTI